MEAVAKRSTIIILICSNCSLLYAQIDLTKFEIGITANAFIYQGDLTPSRFGSYRTVKPGAGFYINRLLSPGFTLRTNFTFGTLKGDDSKYNHPGYRQQRNFNFRSPVFEISELVVVNVLQENSLGISPYVFGGAGLSFLNIKRDWSRFNAEYFSSEPSTLAGLATDVAHSLPKAIPVIPVGVGARYRLSQKISVTVETSYRFSFTDYLDGFSKAANPVKNDHYSTHSVGIVYHFIKKNSLKCPVNVQISEYLREKYFPQISQVSFADGRRF